MMHGPMNINFFLYSFISNMPVM